MLRCGLLGRRLGHSYSPAIHAMLGDYEYGLYEKEPEALEEFLRHGGLDGLNVTIPYKKTVMQWCDALSDEALRIGSVNTLTVKDGKITGYNTDCDGFAWLLQASGFDPAGKKALVLGSGGASLAVQDVLRNRGAQVVVVSRTGEDNYGNLARHRDAALLVNATPVGMYPHTGVSPVAVEDFPQCRAVLDLIYNPAKTRLLLDAEKLGIPAFNGLSMLVAQAARASALFTGAPVPAQRIGQITEAIARRERNIILIGMPGCGKTSVAKALAAQTGREFLDCDACLEQAAGKSIPEIFARDGEAAFRRLETQTLQSLCCQSGKVIATGGGVVTRPENRDILRQNGVLVFLQRPLEELQVSGRPLSEQKGVAALAEQRLPLYRAWSDCVVDVCGAQATANLIRKELEL